MTQLGRVRMRTCFSSRQEAGCKASPGEGSDLVDLDIFLIHKKNCRSGHSLFTEPSVSNVSTVSSIEERDESEA